MKERKPKGKKVFLRPPKADDFAEFTSRAKASVKFHQGLVSPPLDLESFGKYIARSKESANRNFLICQIIDGEIAGVVNLSQIFRGGFQNAYLGYYLFEDYAGKGLMTEGIGLILRFAFKELKLHRVEANIQPQNLASRRVLERTGFTKEGFSRKYLKICGRWRDHERWAMIVEDWKKNGKQGS